MALIILIKNSNITFILEIVYIFSFIVFIVVLNCGTTYFLNIFKLSALQWESYGIGNPFDEFNVNYLFQRPLLSL